MIFHSIGRAPQLTRPRIDIRTPNTRVFAPFYVDVAVGEPGFERMLMTVRGPGLHTFPTEIAEGQLVSVRYSGGSWPRIR